MTKVKKPRLTGRGTKPRGGGRMKAPAKKARREPCPKSRAKRETEAQREHETKRHEPGGPETGTDHERRETRVVYRDGEIAHEEREKA